MCGSPGLSGLGLLLAIPLQRATLLPTLLPVVEQEERTTVASHRDLGSASDIAQDSQQWSGRA